MKPLYVVVSMIKPQEMGERMTESKWKFVEKTKVYTYWSQEDGTGRKYYTVTTTGNPPKNSEGGYYNLDALKQMKGDR